MNDELVNRLHRYSENCVAYKLDADFASAVQEAADAIEELSKENESLGKDLTSAVELLKKKRKPKWIPVTERLPEKDTNVIANTKDFGVCETLFYDETHWYDPVEVYANYGTVTHWMPLPSPPEEEGV